MRSGRSVLPSLALGFLLLHLAVSLPWALFKSVRRMAGLVRAAGETPLEERSRVYGAEYAQAIEEIRRTIPRDGAYALVDGNPREAGGPLWVRFDLAPRRAVFLGSLDGLGDDIRALRRRLPRAARWVVIVDGPYGAPVLLERHRFLRRLRERPGA